MDAGIIHPMRIRLQRGRSLESESPWGVGVCGWVTTGRWGTLAIYDGAVRLAIVAERPGLRQDAGYSCNHHVWLQELQLVPRLP